MPTNLGPCPACCARPCDGCVPPPPDTLHVTLQATFMPLFSPCQVLAPFVPTFPIRIFPTPNDFWWEGYSQQYHHGVSFQGGVAIASAIYRIKARLCFDIELEMTGLFGPANTSPSTWTQSCRGVSQTTRIIRRCNPFYYVADVLFWPQQLLCCNPNHGANMILRATVTE